MPKSEPQVVSMVSAAIYGKSRFLAVIWMLSTFSTELSNMVIKVIFSCNDAFSNPIVGQTFSKV